MPQRRLEQLAKLAEGVRPDRLVLIVRQHDVQRRGPQQHVEMIEPEPAQLLLELRRIIQRAQHGAGSGGVAGQLQLARIVVGKPVALGPKRNVDRMIKDARQPDYRRRHIGRDRQRRDLRRDVGR